MPSLVKELMMKELEREFESYPYAFFSSFSVLPDAELSEFRRAIEKVSSRTMMVKHALAKKVFEGRKLNDADKLLKGSVLVTFGKKDPQVISKALLDFIKTHDKLASTGVLFEDKVYDQEFVKQLSKLPSRQELLTQVVVRVKSPITGFVLTLSALMRGVVIALNEVKKQKEAAGQTA